MELRTQPTVLKDAMAGWWPSRYGAGDEAGALRGATGAWVAPLAIV